MFELVLRHIQRTIKLKESKMDREFIQHAKFCSIEMKPDPKIHIQGAEFFYLTYRRFNFSHAFRALPTRRSIEQDELAGKGN
jgi:hypothetical protein